MKQIMKRLLGIMLVIAMVIGMVPVSGMSEVKAMSAGDKVYFDTKNTSWFLNEGCSPWVIFKSGTGTGQDVTGWTAMIKVDGESTVFYAEIPTEAAYVQFSRASSSGTKYGGTTTMSLSQGDYNMFVANGWSSNDNYWSNGGSWENYANDSGSGNETVSTDTFYVDTMLVDYYNNNRVGKDDSNAYRYDNQGSWTGSTNNNAPYSSLNTWISGLSGYATSGTDNGDGTRTIYWDNTGNDYEPWICYWGGEYNNTFKQMKYIGYYDDMYLCSVDIPTGATNCMFTRSDNYDNRLTGDLTLSSYNLYDNGWSFYGDVDQAVPLYFGDLYHQVQLTGSTSGTVNGWYRGANVSLTNVHAVAQGIVGSHLVNGKLVTSYDSSVAVPFFEEGAYSNQSNYMKFYNNLKFPFKSVENNGVTTYSFNSTEQTVYYDYSSNTIKSSTNTITDVKGQTGYFPFNETNPSNDNDLNYGFGTKFTIPFTISEDGKDKNGEDIKFTFSGDDDVWVYIDDALVLDMGGAHELAEGTINFATQTATVTTGSADAKTDYQMYGGNSSFTSNGKETISFANITVKLKDGSTTTLDEYIKIKNEVHTLTMYYMERGMWNSNMSISFTFSPVPSGLVVSKDVDTTNVNDGLKSVVETADEYAYKIEATNLKGTTDSSYGKFTKFALTNHDGISISGTTTENKIISVRADQYAHTFLNASGESAFEPGTHFVITETLTENNLFTYETDNTIWKVYDADNNYAIKANGTGLVATFDMGTKSSSTLESYNYSVNYINKLQVGSFSITKKWLEGQAAPENGEYTLRVLVDLDGDKKTFGYSTYALTGKIADINEEGNITLTDKVVNTDAYGNITLSAGQTVVFEGIPVGAKVQAVETTTGGKNWMAVTASGEATVEAGKTNNVAVTNRSISLAYGFYLVDENGDPVLDSSNNVTKVTDEIATDITVDSTTTLNASTLESSIPAGYELYDPSTGLAITVSSTSSSDNNWTITKGTDMKATTFVEYENTSGGTSRTYENSNSTNVMNETYNDTTVWFAVRIIQANPDTVVIDFGLPVDIDVLVNDTFGTTADVTAVTNDGTSYGDVAVNTDKTVRYTPSKSAMNMSEADVFSYTATYKSNTYKGDVTVIPATNIYFEDDFLTFTNSTVASTDVYGVWAQDGTTVSGATQEEDRPGVTTGLADSVDANNVYGYDDAYKASTEFSLGSARKVTVNAATGTPTAAPTATFTFTGTGFDVISLTDNRSGAINVAVYSGTSATGTAVKNYIVNNYYGYTYSDGEWIVTDSTDENALYQVPVIKVDDLTYGTYTVVIKAAYLSSMDIQAVGSYSVWIDAIRIYNPAEGNTTAEGAYAQDGESNPLLMTLKSRLIAAKTFTTGITSGGSVKGAMFIDGKSGSEVSIADYENQGPNNETYLEGGQGVGFALKVTSSENPSTFIQSIQIGAKLADGTTAALYQGEQKLCDVTTATNMFYKLNTITWSDSDNDGVWISDPIVLSCSAPTESILSLTDIKITSSKKVTIATTTTSNGTSTASVDEETNEDYGISTMSLDDEDTEISTASIEVISTEETQTYSLRVMSALYVAEPFEPETLEAEWKAGKAGKKSTLTITTSEDVEMITVNGEEITEYKTVTKTVGSKRDKQKVTYRVWTFEVTQKEAGTYEYEIVAYNEEGTASEAIESPLTVEAAKQNNKNNDKHNNKNNNRR